MKKKNKLLTTLVLLSVWLSLPLMLTAQVTIGANEKPKDFSLLELNTSIAKLGLRLPQLTTVERDALLQTTDALASPGSLDGLAIYNLDIDCVEYWNNEKWVSLCDDEVDPPGSIASLTCSSVGTINVTQGTPANITGLSLPYTKTGGTVNLTDNQLLNTGGSPVSGLSVLVDGAQALSAAGGNISIKVTGTPSASGSISIPITVGEASCSITVNSSIACTSITGVSISGGTTITQYATTAITLTATVTGGAATSYEWFKGGISQGTTATNKYTVPQSVKDVSGTHAYTVKAINACSNVTSSAANVVVNACTKITGVSISGGTTITQWDTTTAITLTATVTGGAATSYEWYKGGSLVTTTTTNKYTVPQSVKNVSGTHAYTVKAINACSNVTSATATNVVVNACTKITNVSISGGTTITQYAATAITLTATVTGGAATSYGWYKGGSLVTTTSTNKYTVPQSVKDVSGTHAYTVKAINACSNVTSAAATNVVVTACTKLTGVTIKGTTAYTLGETISLEVDAITPSGATTPTYQWYKGTTALTNGGTVSGATSSKLTITSAAATDAGEYSLKVSNGCSSNISSAAVNITICTPVTGVTIKGTTGYVPGETISLEVDAVTPSGATMPLTYRWYKDATALSDGGTVSGATSSKLTITSAAATDAGSYSLKVSNGCSSDIESAAANVTILAFSPNHNVNSGTTTLYTSAVFYKGTGDTKTRGTGVSHTSMPAGVFRYTGGGGKTFSGHTYTHASGVTITIPATTLATGSGELTVNVEGTVSSTFAGKAFDVPVMITIGGANFQFYVRVNAGCGAYKSATRVIPSLGGDPNWQQWQCYNLGASTSIDPFVPHKNLHGAKYRFGAKNASLTMAQDQANSGAISGWSSKPVQTGTADWTTANNPCPAGWRLPTITEWNQVIATANNAQTNEGSSWTDSATNYDTGKHFGAAIFLPAAGERTAETGELRVRGAVGYYRVSTRDPQAEDWAQYGTFNNIMGATKGKGSRRWGFSVRCVAE